MSEFNDNCYVDSKLRWSTTVTAKPKTSRQKQKPYSKTKNLTAKTKYLTAKTKNSRQKQKPHGKNKIPHDKTKNLTAKPNTSQQKPNTSRQKQIPTAKPKLFFFCCEEFGLAVRYVVFAVRFLVLP